MRVWKVLKIAVCIVLFVLLGGLVVEHLWNWLMPEIFGLKALTFAQAIGLLVLSKILLGGIHKHGGRGGREWKRHMEERWAQMSPEEREKFRSGMRGRRGCGFGRPNETTDHSTEQKAS